MVAILRENERIETNTMYTQLKTVMQILWASDRGARTHCCLPLRNSYLLQFHSFNNKHYKAAARKDIVLHSMATRICQLYQNCLVALAVVVQLQRNENKKKTNDFISLLLCCSESRSRTKEDTHANQL